MNNLSITWQQFREQIARLRFLPGYERVEPQHLAEWYQEIFSTGWFPFELKEAIDWLVSSGAIEFFPPPGRIRQKMLDHRLERYGGRDWESTHAALQERARELLEQPKPKEIE